MYSLPNTGLGSVILTLAGLVSIGVGSVLRKLGRR
jgi:LPXTG-motif cell wall-anchored protein